MRFEDNNKDPAQVLEGVFKFVLGLDSLDGTVIQKRIHDEIAAKSQASGTLYKPR